MGNRPDVFYIRTKDGSEFAIFDLDITEDKMIEFNFSSVDESDDKEGYGDEVTEIITNLVTESLKNYMGKC
jgi:hypothetical protein